MKTAAFHESDFDDIRPYRDDEIRDILNQIRQHPWILSALRRFYWPRLPMWLEVPVEKVLKFYLRLRLIPIHTVDDWHFRFFRKTVLKWIDDRTMTELTYTGLEGIDRNKASLFITNHRDIVIDSAFLAYGLMKAGLRTPEIAFGDNLMFNKFVTDLIRINKGFIVRRNVENKFQMAESLKLSHYIHYTLENNRSIWIAQTGGRAKDGDDRTNPALIKMIYMSQVRGGMKLSEFVEHCNIVPVSISYEFDPCDIIKAREIYRKRYTDNYQKNPHEDLISILKGINENKGRVHFSIGKPLRGTWKNANEIAEDVDQFIIRNYKFFSSNYIAYDLFTKSEKYSSRYNDEEKDFFLSRYRSIPPEITECVMEIYARPLINYENMSDRLSGGEIREKK